MSFDFSVLISLINFFISFFERVVGNLISFLGRLIVVVMSLFKIVEYEYLIADKKREIDAAALFVRFSAMYCFTSSVVICDGCFFVKLIRFLFDFM